jgi:hypothetical protein
MLSQVADDEHELQRQFLVGVTDLDDDAAFPDLPQVDLQAPHGEVVEECAARFVGRFLTEVRPEILPPRWSVPGADRLGEPVTIRPELGMRGPEGLVPGVVVPEVVTHPQIDVVHGGVCREHLEEQVVEQGDPLIHGSHLNGLTGDAR